MLAGASGAIVGLFFGVPPAWGAHDMGLPWMPYGVGVVAMCLVAGLLIAFTIESICPPGLLSSDQHSAEPDMHQAAPNPVRRRLAQGKAGLDHLDAMRQRPGATGFGTATEDRIVWGELLDLELQDIDEQVSRICRDNPLDTRTITSYDTT